TARTSASDSPREANDMRALGKRSACRQLADVQSQPNGAYCGRVGFDCGRGLEQMPRANSIRLRAGPLAVQAWSTYGVIAESHQLSADCSVDSGRQVAVF